jgi:hypothetical protein
MGIRGQNDNDGDYEGAIRRALAVLDGLRALYEGTRALRAAAVREYKRRPADAGLIAAHVGAQLLYLARFLPEYRPARPPGCPRVPRPEDLLAAFEGSLAEAEGGGSA